MNPGIYRDLKHDLLLPTALFALLGGMSWAVRGSSGYGATMGCIFAGVLWGTAWWYIARDPSGTQSRRYTSGWIILAMTVGIGIAGGRGWAQWPNFFDGQLQTNAAKGEFVPISRAYGFLWLFIAGVPWAGLGACMLAWCGSRKTRGTPHFVTLWVLRIAFGVAGAYIAGRLYANYPQVFLPMYKSMQAQYHDFETNPGLRRLVNDSRSAITHFGLYLGFLLFEIARRDWKNVTLIGTVGLINGIGWSLLQNWKWADNLFPSINFNWWRCWESTGGMSIGIAFGVAYYLVNRRLSEEEVVRENVSSRNQFPNLERFGAYFGLIFGVGVSIRNGLKGWANIYLGNEDYWGAIFWNIVGPAILTCFALAALWTFVVRRLPKDFDGDLFPHAHVPVWIVLIVMNILAQLVTGPIGSGELVFNVYYLILFTASALIIEHYRRLKRSAANLTQATSLR